MSDFAVILAPPAPINVSLAGPSQIDAQIKSAPPINVAILAGPAFHLQLTTSPINVATTLSQSTVPGPRGPRGAGFIGAYTGQVNLPPIDGTNITDGDFAITSDGEIWRVQ